ncbi:MAG: MoxR family ATPase [Ketobacter sp.]|nr:MAG: MoxR family ATPase [Ketobacter sp.]
MNIKTSVTSASEVTQETQRVLSDFVACLSEQLLGQSHLVERLMIALLADGHILVEGVPGLAKTRAIKQLAAGLDAQLSRLQFTPDLLPGDITGGEVYYHDFEGSQFRFQPGPIFGNLVLADEINRAPAKVQSALLEAMEERQVTVAGQSHDLPALFLVMATQNPIEQEGTYPLPEAQLDRFLLHVRIDYPDEEAEAAIIRLVRSEEENRSDTNSLPVMSKDVIFRAREQVRAVQVSQAAERYMVALVFATRYPERYGDDLRGKIQMGASPRGSLALDRASRAHAWLKGRDFVTPEDIRAVLHDVLRHRLLLSYEAAASGVTADAVLDELVAHVPPL